jgi:integrase
LPITFYRARPDATGRRTLPITGSADRPGAALANQIAGGYPQMKPKGHVRRRGANAFEVVIYLGNIGGRRLYHRETVHGTEADADLRRAELVAAHADDRLPTNAGLTIAVLAEEWLDSIRDEAAPNTIRNRRSQIDRHIVPMLGSRRVRAVTVPILEQTKRALLRGEGPTGQKLSGDTVRGVMSALSGMLRLAARYGWRDDNPVALVALPARKKGTYQLPELEAILALAVEAGRRDPDRHSYVLLVLATGARRGEACGVRWCDLDLEAGIWNLCRQITRGAEGQPTWIEKLPKGEKARTVALDADVVRELRACRARALERALAVGIALDPAAYVFARTIDGTEAWQPNAVNDWWRRAAAKTGTPARPHGLRHLRATDMAEVALPPVVQAALGHASLETTNRYLHVRADADRAAADALAERRRAARK